MSDRDDIRQPQDHLPPQDEQSGDDASTPTYPGTEEPSAGSAVSPDTAAEPDAPARHGVDKLPPSGR